jgi:hypothetical protein
MVIAAMAVPEEPESSGWVLSAEQHFPSKVTGGCRSGQPQKARDLLFTPEDPFEALPKTPARAEEEATEASPRQEKAPSRNVSGTEES